jgi:hypothetical protein
MLMHRELTQKSYDMLCAVDAQTYACHNTQQFPGLFADLPTAYDTFIQGIRNHPA